MKKKEKDFFMLCGKKNNFLLISSCMFMVFFVHINNYKCSWKDQT